MKNLKVKIIYDANIAIDEFEEKFINSKGAEKIKEEVKKEVDSIILAEDGRNETSEIDMKWSVE